jgi:membrane protein insertase Oxa1/YidC/SpoIIIJ
MFLTVIELISNIFNTLLYQPVYNLVVIVYNLTPGPNFGWAMVGLALLIRFLFIAFTVRGLRTDRILKELEPQVAAIEADHYTPAQEKRGKIINLIKSKGINPYTEIYTFLGQVAFLAINYKVIQDFNPSGFDNLYSFVYRPEQVNTIFFGIDLLQSSMMLSAIAAGLLMIEQIWEYTEKKDFPTAFSERWFPLLLAGVTFILLVILPSAKAVFVATSVLFSLCLKAVITLAKPKQ